MLLAGGLLPLLEVGGSIGAAACGEPEKNKFMNDNKRIYDCIIVGGGAAGLSAALVLGRSRRRVLVCDKGDPRNAPAHEAHGFLTRDGVNPLELLKVGREQIKPYKSVEFQAVGVEAITKLDHQFAVTFADGTTRNSRKILLAFGVTDEFPPIKNFAAFWGKSVFHCPYCHGYEVRDQPLAVVGNGEVGVGMVALLKNWSANLVLCTDGEALLSAAERSLLAKHKVIVREGKIVRFEGENGQLENIVFDDGGRLARSGLMIRPKQRLRSNFAVKLGCELNEMELIKVVDIFNETTIKGVYAAGDIATMMQSVAVAVAHGSAAAAGINHALIKEDFV